MKRKRTQQGGAMLEFALVLPFALLLFLTLGDFSLFLFRQTLLETATRRLGYQIARSAPDLLGADTVAMQGIADIAAGHATVQDAGLGAITVALDRRYACPQDDGSEWPATGSATGCRGERVYLAVASRVASHPIVRPLALAGFPAQALSRVTIRIR